MESIRERTVVLGIGNTIRQDDGAGVHALRKLEADPRCPPNTALIDGGTHGLDLLAELHQCSKLLVLDAADTGEKPGTIVRMSGDELRAVPRGKTVHQLGLADLLATLSFVSEKPVETVLLGIQPEHSGWGTELSPSVAASLDEVVKAAIEQLVSWRQNDATGTHCDFHSDSVRAF